LVFCKYALTIATQPVIAFHWPPILTSGLITRAINLDLLAGFDSDIDFAHF